MCQQSTKITTSCPHMLSLGIILKLIFLLTYAPPYPPPRPQSSMNRMAIQALEKMETRKFKAKGKVQRESSCGASDSLSSSSTSDCAICLEKYIDGEVRKIFFWFIFFFFKLHFLCSNSCGLQFQNYCVSQAVMSLAYFVCHKNKNIATNSLLNVTCMNSSNRLDEEKGDMPKCCCTFKIYSWLVI